MKCTGPPYAYPEYMLVVVCPLLNMAAVGRIKNLALIEKAIGATTEMKVEDKKKSEDRESK